MLQIVLYDVSFPRLFLIKLFPEKLAENLFFCSTMLITINLECGEEEETSERDSSLL